ALGTVAIDSTGIFAISQGTAAPGRLVIRGGELVLTDSLIEVANTGTTGAPALELTGTGNLKLLSSNVLGHADGAGRGPDVRLSAGNVTVNQNGSVESWSASAARAGDLAIDAIGRVTIDTG